MIYFIYTCAFAVLTDVACTGGCSPDPHVFFCFFFQISYVNVCMQGHVFKGMAGMEVGRRVNLVAL